MSILVLTLCLNHCSTTDFIAIGGGIYSGLENKPNPMTIIRVIEKEKNDDK